jgi:hypothetical protein
VYFGGAATRQEELARRLMSKWAQRKVKSIKFTENTCTHAAVLNGALLKTRAQVAKAFYLCVYIYIVVTRSRPIKILQNLKIQALNRTRRAARERNSNAHRFEEAFC